MVIEQIKKSYKKREILKGVSFSVEAGEAIGLLGSNGSGKSTLLSILAGTLRADTGSFVYDGTDLLSDSQKRSEVVGYVPQSTPLLEELTAWDNLCLWYSVADLRKELSDGVLAMLGVDEFVKTPVYKMSGGMKKRLSIGCAVAHKPKVLLLDEPSAALDLVCKEKILNYLQDFKAAGNTVIVATHDLQDLPICDRLLILKDGVMHPFVYDGDLRRLVSEL